MQKKKRKKVALSSRQGKDKIKCLKDNLNRLFFVCVYYRTCQSGFTEFLCGIACTLAGPVHVATIHAVFGRRSHCKPVHTDEVYCKKHCIKSNIEQ